MGILSTNSLPVRTKPGSNSPLTGKVPPGSSAWRSSVKNAIRSSAALREMLQLPLEDDKVQASGEANLSGTEVVERSAGEAGEDYGFPVFVPREYAARIEKGNLEDPLLLQVLPQAREAAELPGFVGDPVGDNMATLAPGLIQKYQGRALLITTGVCAVHCRYCFRRHFPYGESKMDAQSTRVAMDHLRADKSIDEVILSGGDPLMLTDDGLKALVDQIAGIEHISRLRIHTRLPVMIPSRINEPLLEWLTETRLTPVMVLHANHPAELDCPDVAAAIARLSSAGVPLLNQAVLLRGINDDVETLTSLSRDLVNLRVMPYYLHLLDKVAGAAHFDVSQERGEELIAELRKVLPGYAIPRLAQEVAGELGKRVLA